MAQNLIIIIDAMIIYILFENTYVNNNVVKFVYAMVIYLGLLQIWLIKLKKYR